MHIYKWKAQKKIIAVGARYNKNVIFGQTFILKCHNQNNSWFCWVNFMRLLCFPHNCWSKSTVSSFSFFNLALQIKRLSDRFWVMPHISFLSVLFSLNQHYVFALSTPTASVVTDQFWHHPEIAFLPGVTFSTLVPSAGLHSCCWASGQICVSTYATVSSYLEKFVTFML